jgi:hypothetical protein
MNAPRNIILWFSTEGIPDDLLASAKINGYDIINTINYAKAKSKLPYSKGLLIKADDPGFVSSALRKLGTEAGMHGVPIAILALDTGQEKQWVSRIMEKFKPPSSNVKDVPWIRRKDPKWEELMKELTDFHNGPVFNSGLRIIVKDSLIREHHPEYLEDEFLIKRALPNFEKIRLSKLRDGYSDARVYKVIPILSEGNHATRALPFLIKIDKPEKIALEMVSFQDFVERAISFQHRPNFFLEQCYATPKSAVLVQDFIQNAISFRQALGHGKSAMLITSLFEGALQPWRLYTKPGPEKLSSYFLSRPKKGALFLKGIEDRMPLEEAYHWALSEMGTKLDPSRIISTFKSCVPQTCRLGKIHGDLHANNIFVDAGTHEIIIIDFCKTGIGASVIDPTCLEVDIVFRAGCEDLFIDNLYTTPLSLPPSSMLEDGIPWVWEAVRATRLFGRIDEENKSYTLALIGHLLRFAAYEDNGSIEIRGRAYGLAERLLKSI